MSQQKPNLLIPLLLVALGGAMLYQGAKNMSGEETEEDESPRLRSAFEDDGLENALREASGEETDDMEDMV